jgi:hypothetical protein
MVEIQDGSEKLEQIYSKNYGYKAVDYEVDEEGEYTIMEKELYLQKATKRTATKQNATKTRSQRIVTKSQRSRTKTRKRSE